MGVLRSQSEHKLPAIAEEAEDFYEVLKETWAKMEAATQYVIFHTPMFLENILYQTTRLRDADSPAFYWPLNRDARFSYINCIDVGVVGAKVLCEFDSFSHFF